MNKNGPRGELQGTQLITMASELQLSRASHVPNDQKKQLELKNEKIKQKFGFFVLSYTAKSKCKLQSADI